MQKCKVQLTYLTARVAAIVWILADPPCSSAAMPKLHMPAEESYCWPCRYPTKIQRSLSSLSLSMLGGGGGEGESQ